MNERERLALRKLIDFAENNAFCEKLHHPKKWQHEAHEKCPARQDMIRQLDIAKKLLSDLK